MDEKNCRLPKAVYYQCIWTVKDIYRLEQLAMAAEEACYGNELVFFEMDDGSVDDRAVLGQARFKMKCIKSALSELPREYRQGTIDSIIHNTSFNGNAHENTWRKWRNIFIRKLAKELELV